MQENTWYKSVAYINTNLVTDLLKLRGPQRNVYFKEGYVQKKQSNFAQERYHWVFPQSKEKETTAFGFPYFLEREFCFNGKKERCVSNRTVYFTRLR